MIIIWAVFRFKLLWKNALLNIHVYVSCIHLGVKLMAIGYGNVKFYKIMQIYLLNCLWKLHFHHECITILFDPYKSIHLHGILRLLFWEMSNIVSMLIYFIVILIYISLISDEFEHHFRHELASFVSLLWNSCSQFCFFSPKWYILSLSFWFSGILYNTWRLVPF